MRLQTLLITLIIAVPFLLLGQVKLEPGFELLERGQFAQAERFFASALKQEPQNKTAIICYGRAVGLNGAPRKALTIFSELQQQFPNDQEVQLNLAEAMMWGKNYSQAEQLYNELLKLVPSDFTANLGAANARAGQKNYTAALPFIEEALLIQPGNTNALISKKFILLGMASQEKETWKYDTAHQRLDRVEALFPGDKDARLLRADLYLSDQQYRQAQSVYKNMVQDSIELVRAFNGLSYTSVLLKKNKEALAFAKKAVTHSKLLKSDSIQRISAGIQLVNALALNRRFKEAFEELDAMEEELGPALPISLAEARLKVWNRDFKEGELAYDSLLLDYPNSFDLLMGMVDVKRARHQLDDALDYLEQAREILPNQPDAFRLWQELSLSDQAALQIGGSYLKDSGGNIGQGLSARFEAGRFGNFQPFLQVEDWQAFQEGSSDKAKQQTLQAGTKVQLNSDMNARLMGGTTKYLNEEAVQQNAFRGEVGLNFLLGKYHNFDVALSRDLHNYTADLVRNGITRDHLVLTYNFASASRLGLYAQYIRTAQSDGNKRDLVFASLYFKVLEAPLLKVGVNYNTFGFERQESERYFSPTNSTASELFVQLASDQSSRKKWFYQAFAAFGIQRVSINDPQQTNRFEFLLGHRLASNFEIRAHYQTGNTAQSSISGYAYQRASLQLRYQFPVSASTSLE